MFQRKSLFEEKEKRKRARRKDKSVEIKVNGFLSKCRYVKYNNELNIKKESLEKRLIDNSLLINKRFRIKKKFFFQNGGINSIKIRKKINEKK